MYEFLYISALLLSLLLFMVLMYLTYLNTKLFYHSKVEGNLFQKWKTQLFYIGVCTSIISDIIMFHASMHGNLVLKNMFILLIIAVTVWSDSELYKKKEGDHDG